MTEIISQQLLDPFRAGLIFFLVVTAHRTRTTMGLRTPLILGVIFVAAMLPLTTGGSMVEQAGGVLPAMAWGLVTNTILLGIVLLGWAIWERTRRQ